MTRPAKIAAGLRTPFYLFDPEKLLRSAEAWQSAARRGKIRLHYPYKTNRDPAVLALLARAEIGAEVVTLSDLRRAVRLGISGDRIVVHGPAKERELIDRGLEVRVTFVADGVEDARAIFDRSASAGARPPLYLLRLAVSSAETSQAIYGLPARDLLAFVRGCRARGDPLPHGIAFHLGTGISSMRPYREAIVAVASCASELSSLGAPIRVLDVGGGFAAEGEARLDGAGKPRRAPGPPREVLRALSETTARYLGPSVRVVAEPGRALVSDAFDLVSRVVRVKRIRAGADVFLDASRVSHAFFVPRGRHGVEVYPEREPPRTPIRLWGPLGVDLELLVRSARIGLPVPGDVVVIRSVGAYNANASNSWSGRRALVRTRRASSGRKR